MVERVNPAGQQELHAGLVIRLFPAIGPVSLGFQRYLYQMHRLFPSLLDGEGVWMGVTKSLFITFS
jgi:hypothetical protein